MFYTLNEFLEDTEDVRHDDSIKSKVIDKLQFLRFELAKHFPNISRDDLSFVRNPYLVQGCGSGSRSAKIPPLSLSHRLFNLKSNLAKRFCPFPNVD